MSCWNCEWWCRSSHWVGFCCKPNARPFRIHWTFVCIDYKPKPNAGGEVKR